MSQLLNNRKSCLKLYNGLVFQGYSFGYEAACSGELVFSTATFGYPEHLGDPVYEGQLLCITYPIIGNYGAPANEIINGISRNYQGDGAAVKALIITDYCFDYSHWNAVKSLDEWMKENKVVGIYGVDTRAISQYVRDNGTCLGEIIPEGCQSEEALYDPQAENVIAKYSCKEPVTIGNGDKRVVLVDCGVRNSTINALTDAGLSVIKVPYNTDFNNIECDAVVISDGPGNPDQAPETVENIKRALEAKRPILALGMGGLLLAKAAGANVYKLKFGHHSANQPVRIVGTNRCLITFQHHAYAVDADSLSNEWVVSYVNLNDDSVEGIKHSSLPYFSAQFEDKYIFDEFIKAL
jgi:carbamoyl-phosphate synthase small subunit